MAGSAINPLGETSLAVFLFETGKYRLLQYADGRHARSAGMIPPSWLDPRRLLFWDPDNDRPTVWDANGGEIRALEGTIPGPGEIAATPDGRTLVINRTIGESDIWLLTLAD